MCNVYLNFSLLFQSSCRYLTAGIDIKDSVIEKIKVTAI